MVLLVEETNQTHKVNWKPLEILVTLDEVAKKHAAPNAYARSVTPTTIQNPGTWKRGDLHEMSSPAQEDSRDKVTQTPKITLTAGKSRKCGQHRTQQKR